MLYQIKDPASKCLQDLCFSRREEGIRTLDALLEHTHFPGVRLRPLGHLSKCRQKYYLKWILEKLL